MAPTKILFVHCGDNWIRGSERVLLDLVTTMDPSQYCPVIWSNCEPLVKEARVFGFAAKLDTFPILFETTFDFSEFRRLVRTGLELIQENGIRLVHCNGAAPVQWMVSAARRSKIPLLAHLHHPPITLDRFRYRLHCASTVIGVSRACLHGLIEDGIDETRVKVIYNGVRFDEISAACQHEPRITPSDNVPTVLFVGSMIARKGVDVLIEACSILRQEGRRFRLLLVGSGSSETEYRAMVSQVGLDTMALFAGERADAVAVLKDNADIFVLPSRVEALPMVLLEAAALAKPCVATRVGGIPEILKDGETGLLVRPSDPRELASAIGKLLDNRELREAMGRRLHGRACELFSLKSAVQAFESEYAKLLSDGPAMQPHLNSRIALGLIRRSGSKLFRHFLGR